jgi:hypothetical protein
MIATISIVMGLTPWLVELSEPRVQIHDGSLKYMFVTEPVFEDNLKILNMLSSVESRSATFYCPDALYSTWTGRYMSSSPRYVDWAFGTDEYTPADSERVFFCISDEEKLTQAGYRDNSGTKVNFSYARRFYLVEAVRN